MVIDGRTVPAGRAIDTDVCILGAGAAGITLAREFSGAPFQVCLLESGGLAFDQSTQSLYAGTTSGQPYYPLDVCRLRYFGGTTNHWGGFCRPLDDIDFEVRDWVPGSGWPFRKQELMPYYERAQTVCQIGPVAYEYGDWEPDKRLVTLDKTCLTARFFQFSPPTRFGRVYRDDIAKAGNVSLYTYTNALELATDDDVATVTALRVGTLAGNQYHIRAKHYILALGGIENARMLLLSNRRQSAGLCNGHDLVGRYFMDHPILRTGSVLLPSETELSGFDRNMVYGTVKLAPFITVKEDVLRAKRLLNFGVRLKTPTLPSSVASLRAIAKSIRRWQWPDDFTAHLGNVVTDLDAVAETAVYRFRGVKLANLTYWMEPTPNPDSRVTLADEKDDFGLNRARLSWQLTEQDLRSMHEAHRILAAECGASAIGRLKIEFDGSADAWPATVNGSYHHIGTTRMHADPRKGVVNADCRTHQLNNLYIAGSSVFPTAGHANPTLTIVALAIRLADHLKRLMS